MRHRNKKQGGAMNLEDHFDKDVIDNLNDGVYIVDRERLISYWNKGAERITGYSNRQAMGRSCRDNLLNHVTAEGIVLCQTHCPLAACMEDGKVREVEVFLHHADGHRIPVQIRAAPMRDQKEKIIGAVETFSSSTALMTVRRELQDLRRTSSTDSLTGIGNRRYLEGRLRAVVAEFQQHIDPAAGIIFMDIDRFKQINDTCGHEVGDKVLRMVGATLRQSLRQTDVLGRWGGEEFVAVLYDVASLDALKTVSEKLRALVEASRLDFTGGSLSVTISMGATRLLPDDTPESVLHRADTLMYQSKQAGRNRVSFG